MGPAFVASAVLEALATCAGGASAACSSLQQRIVDALRVLCSDAQTTAATEAALALLNQLFGALAASIELDATSAAEDAGSPLCTDTVLSLLRSAASLLVANVAAQPARLLRYVQAAVSLLHRRHALPTDVCGSMLALFAFLLQSSVPHDDGNAPPDAAHRFRAATLDAFAALADSPEEQRQASILEGLLAAAHDVPSADDNGAPRWASLGGALELAACLARLLVKPLSVASSERLLASALLCCSHAGQGLPEVELPLLEHVASPAVRGLAALARVAFCVLISAPLLHSCGWFARSWRVEAATRSEAPAWRRRCLCLPPCLAAARASPTACTPAARVCSSAAASWW
jgi:hypothetical protein